MVAGWVILSHKDKHEWMTSSTYSYFDNVDVVNYIYIYSIYSI